MWHSATRESTRATLERASTAKIPTWEALDTDHPPLRNPHHLEDEVEKEGLVGSRNTPMLQAVASFPVMVGENARVEGKEEEEEEEEGEAVLVGKLREAAADAVVAQVVSG